VILARPKRSYSPEFREEAVRLVIETSRPIAQVARELDVNPYTLNNWVNAYRREQKKEEVEAPLSVGERARLRELEREARELRMENEFLKKAAAYFAKGHR
jgi:transposase-like protein